jgi:hypothetical protein
MYSQPWLSRRFVLTDCSLSWGRYSVADDSIGKCLIDDFEELNAGFRELHPGRLAKIFEDLIHVYIPQSLPSFLLEIDALANLEYAKSHHSALTRMEYSPDTYTAARAAVASTFEAALAAVFKAALPLHGLENLSLVRYRQMLHGVHLADFADDNTTYQVAFTANLILQCVDDVNTWRRIWTSV